MDSLEALVAGEQRMQGYTEYRVPSSVKAEPRIWEKGEQVLEFNLKIVATVNQPSPGRDQLPIWLEAVAQKFRKCDPYKKSKFRIAKATISYTLESNRDRNLNDDIPF